VANIYPLHIRRYAYLQRLPPCKLQRSGVGVVRSSSNLEKSAKTLKTAKRTAPRHFAKTGFVHWFALWSTVALLALHVHKGCAKKCKPLLERAFQEKDKAILRQKETI
tara:strand:- start:5094 stop:5417 length:324 start_codon:yes stop_codon:yes gene_type:complete